MEKLKTLRVPPLGKHEILVVKPDVWDSLIEHINAQNNLTNQLRKEILILKENHDKHEEQIKVLAKALGGVYENQE